MTINHKKRRLINNTANLSVSTAQSVQKLDLVMATLMRVLKNKGLVSEEDFIEEFAKMSQPKEEQNVQTETT